MIVLSSGSGELSNYISANGINLELFGNDPSILGYDVYPYVIDLVVLPSIFGQVVHPSIWAHVVYLSILSQGYIHLYGVMDNSL